MKKLVSVTLLVGLLLAILLTGCAKTPEELYQEQYDLGMRYLSEGNYEEAIIAFEAAIEINPRAIEAYIAIADTYVQSGDAPQAVRYLDQVLTDITNGELKFETEDGEIDQEFADEIYDELNSEKEEIYNELTQEEKDILNAEGIYGTEEEKEEASWVPLALDSPEVLMAEEYIVDLNRATFFPSLPVFESIEEVSYEYVIDLYLNYGFDGTHIDGIGSISEVDIIETMAQDLFNPNFEFGENYEFDDISLYDSELFFIWHENYRGYTSPDAKGMGNDFHVEIVEAYDGDTKLIVDVLEYEYLNITFENDMFNYEIYNSGTHVGTFVYDYNAGEESATYDIDPGMHAQTRYVLIPKGDGGYFIESKTHKN